MAVLQIWLQTINFLWPATNTTYTKSRKFRMSLSWLIHNLCCYYFSKHMSTFLLTNQPTIHGLPIFSILKQKHNMYLRNLDDSQQHPRFHTYFTTKSSRSAKILRKAWRSLVGFVSTLNLFEIRAQLIKKSIKIVMLKLCSRKSFKF